MSTKLFCSIEESISASWTVTNRAWNCPTRVSISDHMYPQKIVYLRLPYTYTSYMYLPIPSLYNFNICITMGIAALRHWGQWWCRGTKCDCKIDWLWDRFSLGGNEIFIYIYIFVSALWCRGEAKRGAKFRHSKRNASKTRRKVGNGVS